MTPFASLLHQQSLSVLPFELHLELFAQALSSLLWVTATASLSGLATPAFAPCLSVLRKSQFDPDKPKSQGVTLLHQGPPSAWPPTQAGSPLLLASSSLLLAPPAPGLGAFPFVHFPLYTGILSPAPCHRVSLPSSDPYPHAIFWLSPSWVLHPQLQPSTSSSHPHSLFSLAPTTSKYCIYFIHYMFALLEYKLLEAELFSVLCTHHLKQIMEQSRCSVN